MGIAAHDMDREDARYDDSREEDREDDRSGYRYGEDCDRVVDRAKYSWYVPDKKKHKRSSCPEKMIIDEIGSFSDFFPFWDIFCFHELWYDILDVGTSPAPASELLILRSDGSIEIGFVDEIHLAYGRCVDDTKSPTPSEVASPVLEAIFDDRSE